MNLLLLAGAAVIFLCLALTKISAKLGFPTLLAFLLLGMLFGCDGLFHIPFEDYALSESVCTVALIFIMFYGGFGTSWRQARPIVGRAVILSTLGVILTALLVGLFCHYVLKIAFWDSMLLGSVISSTDAASVFAILRSKRLDLRENTASLLEVESGSNDPCSYMLTVIILGIMSGQFGSGQLVELVLAQLGWGVVVGIGPALIGRRLLEGWKGQESGSRAMLVFALAVAIYALSSLLGGNGYLSVYLAGIILGNANWAKKRELVHFFDGLTGLMQMLIFFLLGLLATPSRMPEILGPALAITIFLTIIARPLTVVLLLAPCRSSWGQKILVSAAGLRGAASIVFATVAMVSPAYMHKDIFHIVMVIVLCSLGLQGSLLAPLARRLGMIDAQANVLKTFSDYSEEAPVDFIELQIRPDHPWAQRQLKELPALPGLLIVMILRQGERIIPDGQTTILPGDALILSALAPEEDLGLCLREIHLEAGHPWIGRSLSQIKLGPQKLALVLKRQEETSIPNGLTVLQEGDLLVLSQAPR